MKSIDKLLTGHSCRTPAVVSALIELSLALPSRHTGSPAASRSRAGAERIVASIICSDVRANVEQPAERVGREFDLPHARFPAMARNSGSVTATAVSTMSGSVTGSLASTTSTGACRA